MTEHSLQTDQEPLKAEYEENPEAAEITLTATGEQRDDVRSCNVDIGRAMYEAELHEGVAGPGTGACSGDLLLGSLAACAQLTAQAVADAFEIEADIETDVSGVLDLRGTLGIDEDVPVGFEAIELEYTVRGDLEEETVDALSRYAERYCVVYQTLTGGVDVETTWNVDG